MDPQVTKQAETQDEREWELADEDLDRLSVQAYCHGYRYCSGYRYCGPVR